MNGSTTLKQYLDEWSCQASERRAPVAETVRAIALACQSISRLVGRGHLAGDIGATRAQHGPGDTQKELDVLANDLFIDGLSLAPVASVASEEMTEPRVLDTDSPLRVAVDPLDGSSNIETNVSIGTIFSVLPAPSTPPETELGAYMQPGVQQLAAGYVIYGPQTSMALTVGDGTHVFTLDPLSGVFRMTTERARVPPQTREFAINASNRRYWDEPIRIYVDDCLQGSDGPRGEDFNMRWIASLVAEAHRVLSRGGIYLYPADVREGYSQGRLRLIYEANPIAWLMEQAGGAASTGSARVLDVQPATLHQRVPLLFGSRDEVARLDRYHLDPFPVGERSPLFGRRGLFRN